MRLLVDGLNTLPERFMEKGIETYTWGQYVNLDEARAWELDPQVSRVYAVRGFVTEADVKGRLKEFTVVDASASLAAERQQFTEQVGVITAAFYAPAGGERGVGTAAGRERDERIERGRGYDVGNLLAVVHIRYVDADSAQLAGR
jgi:hypothetical protein